MPRLVLVCAFALSGCAAAGMATPRDPTTLAEAERCYPTACGGTGDQALGISLVSIGVIVVGATIRELAF